MVAVYVPTDRGVLNSLAKGTLTIDTVSGSQVFDLASQLEFPSYRASEHTWLLFVHPSEKTREANRSWTAKVDSLSLEVSEEGEIVRIRYFISFEFAGQQRIGTYSTLHSALIDRTGSWSVSTLTLQDDFVARGQRDFHRIYTLKNPLSEEEATLHIQLDFPDYKFGQQGEERNPASKAG